MDGWAEPGDSNIPFALKNVGINIIMKVSCCKELTHKMDQSKPNIIFCALVDCDQPTMTALCEYSGILALSNLYGFITRDNFYVKIVHLSYFVHFY